MKVLELYVPHRLSLDTVTGMFRGAGCEVAAAGKSGPFGKLVEVRIPEEKLKDLQQEATN